MDSKEMVSQLAQFSSLEQLQALGSKLDTLTVAQASTNQISTASLVGKEVTYKASALNLTQGASATFQVQLEGATDDAVAVITDPSGKVVRTLHLGAKPAGPAAATWDGRDEDGNALPSGSYVLTVTGVNKDGTTVDASARVHGTITGVRFEDGTPILRVGGRDVKMSDVIEIDAPTTGA
jgi:flagellar basal-body rod modification protein FlgD